MKKLLMKTKYGKKIVEGLKKIILKQSPHNIALGFAIGVFFGVMPTFGTAFFWAFLFAKWLKASKSSAILGSFVSNPITFPFFYSLDLLVGSFLAGISFEKEYFLTSITKLNFSSMFFLLFLGCILVSLFFATISYFIVYFAIYKYDKLEQKQ